MSKNEFGSKIGLIAATAGSAVGLGNVWRFPAETQANGGAAFLLLYVACVLVLGVPVMLAEFSLGRAGRSDVSGAFKQLSPGTKWWIVGAAAIAVSYIITCYYMVVEGWTLEYLWHSITGSLYSGVGSDISSAAAESIFSQRMADYIGADLPPLAFTWAVIAINVAVLLGGVQKGIERLSNIMMPLLFIMLIVLCGVMLTLPGAGEGIRWFLSPDFSKITASTVISALGQTFFSLSLGMGILITYSAYYPADAKLSRTAVIVAMMSLLVALLVGLVIFPAVSNFGLSGHSLRGTTLVFRTLPEVFACLPCTWIWSVMFFTLLFVAALTSTMSLLEVTIAYLRDHFGMKRTKAVLLSACPLVVLSALSSLSFGSLSDLKIFGLTIFDLLDYFSTNIMLPVVSIAICIYMGWRSPKGLLDNQLTNGGTMRSHVTTIVMFIIRWVAPVLISTILISNFI